jgi:hypothetical protein
MGSGVSTLTRLRKAVLLKAYNLRSSPDQSLMEQFLPFTYQKDGTKGGLYISIRNIKKCLKMDTPEYKWIEEVLQAIFTVPPTSDDNVVIQKVSVLTCFVLFFNVELISCIVSQLNYIFMILYNS